MIFTETPLAGVFLVQAKRIVDHRGHFARGWCRDEFRQHGLNPEVSQLNIGFSHRRGTVRGMHYQIPPHAEAKFVRCTRGAVYDVAVDLRPDSLTCGRWFGAELTADNDVMLYVPAGCAHGYQALTDHAEIYYLASVPYAPGHARGVRYNDPAFAIAWPLPATTISAQDEAWPDFTIDGSALAHPPTSL